MKECRKRNASGAVYDDPRVAVADGGRTRAAAGINGQDFSLLKSDGSILAAKNPGALSAAVFKTPTLQRKRRN
jgi:hypothetical protein